MKESKRTFLTIIIFFVVGGIFGYTITKALQSKNKSSNILKVLEDNCNCKEVNQIIYAKGIQYGEKGLSTERGEYELIDCKFESANKEIERINALLHKKVKNYSDLDLLEIEFENGKTNQKFVIRNGKIQ